MGLQKRLMHIMEDSRKPRDRMIEIYIENSCNEGAELQMWYGCKKSFGGEVLPGQREVKKCS